MDLKKIKRRMEEVIKTDATVASASDFLATHLPFKNLKYVDSGVKIANEKIIAEEKLFNEYFMDKYENHNFVVVQGDSGAGKSHFIRWLMHRYEGEIDKRKEAVVLIKRSQNTLKGALKQIIEAPDLKHLTTNNKDFEKLLEADQNLTPEKLNNNIIMQFATEVLNDNDPNSNLEKLHREWLYYFLVDTIIQQKVLLKPEGPIQRIKSKLASDDNEDIQEEFDVKFNPEDFFFAYTSNILNLMKDPENMSSASAIKCAERLIHDRRGQEFREKVAGYLNQKIETVIQSSIKLRAHDLMEIISNLRSQLKNEGKNLTLFIEDITSFTGIDRGLVEALIVEHEGEPNLCRLSSVVGVTTGYYDSFFPSNMKARVTGRVIISNESVFTNEKDILDLAARYLNAIYLDKTVLENWVRNGALEDNLPVSNENMEHTWSVYKDAEGRVFSLFPFNGNALIHMFETLQEKTPRMFIKEIIKSVFSKFIKDPENFPPAEENIENYFKVPRWDQQEHEKTVMAQGGNLYSRLGCLLKLWGDRTAFRRNGDEITVGGLPEDVFKLFNLPFITGVPTSETKKVDVVKEHKKPGDVTMVPDGGKRQDGGDNPPTTVTPPPPVQPSKPVNPKMDEFNKQYEELKDWFAKGELLKSHKTYRDDISRFLQSSIDWEFEGVSTLLAQSYVSTSRIFIEGQNASEENGFLIKRDQKTYFALIALAAWRILGDKTWAFDRSVNYLTDLTNWLISVKSDFINFVKGPNANGQDRMFEWGITNDYYISSLFGDIKPESTTEFIYLNLIRKDINTTPKEDHCDDWNKLQHKLSISKNDVIANHQFVIRYYNSILGEANAETSSAFFLDAAEILKTIERLQALGWDYSKLNLVEAVASTQKWYLTSNFARKHLVERIDFVLQKEKEQVRLKLNSLTDFIGDLSDIEKINNIFARTKKFLNHTLENAKESYTDEHYKALLNGELNSDSLFKLVKNLGLITAKGKCDQVQYFNLYPYSCIASYAEVFNNFNKLLDIKITKFKKDKATLSNSVENYDSVRDEIKTTLEDMKSKINKVTGGDKNAAK